MSACTFRIARSVGRLAAAAAIFPALKPGAGNR